MGFKHSDWHIWELEGSLVYGTSGAFRPRSFLCDCYDHSDLSNHIETSLRAITPEGSKKKKGPSGEKREGIMFLGMQFPKIN